jgi:hypothetical protein
MPLVEAEGRSFTPAEADNHQTAGTGFHMIISAIIWKGHDMDVQGYEGNTISLEHFNFVFAHGSSFR